MSEIKELIERLCPNGVKYKRLGEVCSFKRGTTITEKDAEDGDIPVFLSDSFSVELQENGIKH